MRDDRVESRGGDNDGEKNAIRERVSSELRIRNLVKYARKNCTDALNFSSGDHSNTLPESQAHASENDKVFAAEHDAIQQVLLVAQNSRVFQVFGVLVAHPGTKAESVGGSHAAEDRLGVSASLSINLQDLRFDPGVNASSDEDNDEKRGQNADEDQGQFPLTNEGNDECADKGCNGLENLTQLLRHA